MTSKTSARSFLDLGGTVGLCEEYPGGAGKVPNELQH